MFGGQEPASKGTSWYGGELQIQSREGISQLLHEALEELARVDPQQSRIVELKFFGGLSIEETAEVMNLGHATIERDWKMVRAWLRRQLD